MCPQRVAPRDRRRVQCCESGTEPGGARPRPPGTTSRRQAETAPSTRLSGKARRSAVSRWMSTNGPHGSARTRQATPFAGPVRAAVWTFQHRPDCPAASGEEQQRSALAWSGAWPVKRQRQAARRRYSGLFDEGARGVRGERREHARTTRPRVRRPPPVGQRSGGEPRRVRPDADHQGSSDGTVAARTLRALGSTPSARAREE
jgi:hypothetical protein